MPWHPDVPDIPIEKPPEISELELIGREALDSMPPREMDEKLEEAAFSVAKAFKKQKGSDYSGCVSIVSVALNMTGSSIGGQFGSLMLAQSENQAKHACKIVFEED